MKTAKDWRNRLHAGDEVTWNDPDGGLCSRRLTLAEIEYLPDGAARIVATDGWTAEIFLCELS